MWGLRLWGQSSRVAGGMLQGMERTEAALQASEIGEDSRHKLVFSLAAIVHVEQQQEPDLCDEAGRKDMDRGQTISMSSNT